VADAPDMGGWVLMDWHRCKERGKKGFLWVAYFYCTLGEVGGYCIRNKYIIILAWSQENLGSWGIV